MAHTLKDKYIEPMAKGEKSHRHKRSDSGYGGTTSDRSSHRYSGSHKSTESSSGSRGYVEPEVSMANQQYNVNAFQNALQAANESKERLLSENHKLGTDLANSDNENRRLRLERDEERRLNDQLRVALDAAKKEIEHQRKELAKHQKDHKKSSSKSSSSKESSKARTVPVYRERSLSPPPNARPTGSSSNSRPTTSRRMSVSNPQGPYTYTIRPAQYPSQ